MLPGKRRFLNALAGFLLLVFVFWGISLDRREVRYTVAELKLDEGSGGDDFRVFDINRHGDVVGTSGEHVFFLSDGGKTVDVGVLSHGPIRINDLGQVFGENYEPSEGFPRHFVWDPNGGLIHKSKSIRPGIVVSNKGLIAGFDDTSPYSFRTWRAGSIETADNPMQHSSISSVLDVNDSDQVLAVEVRDGTQAKVLISETSRTAIFEIGAGGAIAVGADRLNNNGQVLFVVVKDLGPRKRQRRAFLWEKGRSEEVCTPEGRECSVHDMNNHGDIAGSYDTGSGDWLHSISRAVAGDQTYPPPHRIKVWWRKIWQSRVFRDYYLNAKHACIWHDLQFVDLNDCIPSTSGWILRESTAINDRGQVVGQGFFHGKRRSFLLTPITEGRR